MLTTNRRLPDGEEAARRWPTLERDVAARNSAMVSVYDETGQPCVTFGYGTHDEARKGREYVMAALIGVETVRGRR